MNSKIINIALFTPSRNPYSETFIQAHKNYLEGNVFYYYGTGPLIRLEQHDALISSPKNLWLKIYAKLTRKPAAYVWEKRLLAGLRTNNIDVILIEYGTHAHHLRKLLKESALPVIVHFHGYDASTKNVVKRCGNYKEVFRLSKKIIAVSRKMEQMLLDIGCPREKLEYNVYGPQPEFSEVKAQFSKKQLIGIGRFTDKKAPYYTILAFKQVIDKHPDAKLILAGDGVLFNSIQNLIRYYGLEKYVQLAGTIKPEEYRIFLEESWAFVQHSIRAADGDMEGTPLAILEASIAGLPVISTLHAGIPDVIIHGKTGLLSEEHDVSAMADHMVQIFDDVELARELGAAGKKNIQENFSLKTHIDKLQFCLEQAVREYNEKN